MAPIETAGAEEKEEPPIVKELKELDDRYLELKKELEREQWKIQARYTEMQKPLLEERLNVLAPGGDESTGTPGCKGFWCEALCNWDEDGELIEDHDKPVLEYLKDITCEDLDVENPSKGFRVHFTFAPNEYFTNTVLSKEIELGDENPWTQEPSVSKAKGTKVEWKAGKDVTFEKVKKQEKSKKKGKKAPVKETLEPRPSFFRWLSRSMEKDGDIPEDAELMGEDAELIEDEDDKKEFMEFLLGNEYQYFESLRTQLVPFAVRWYTGEAADEKDDDEDEEEEEEDLDSDDEDDSDDDDASPKGKGKGKKPLLNKKKKQDDAAPDNKKEECKQQ